MPTRPCSKCHEGSSVYYRAYSGESLCRKCFLISIEEKAYKTINKFSMLKHDDKVAVAVSGGKDSLSLLYVLNNTFTRHDRSELVAITVDEGIKGYRNESLEIVGRFCADLKVKSKIVTYKELFGIDMDSAMLQRPSKKTSSCSICGTFRRRAIDLAAKSAGANVIATAHNLDDQLQTFIINVLAGDVERIGWTHPEPINSSSYGLKKIKPFAEIYEQEIVFYALQRGIPFQSEDCPYMYESIRTELREFLNKLEKGRPGIKYNTYNSMLKISKSLRLLPPSVQAKKCTICNNTSSRENCSVCKTIAVLTDADKNGINHTIE